MKESVCVFACWGGFEKMTEGARGGGGQTNERDDNRTTDLKQRR